jgi:hypothetical protein
MAEKQLLHSFIGARSHLEVIGRVEIEERKAFDTSAHVEDVALNGLNATSFSALGAVGIEFHPIERGIGSASESVECGPGATAGIERGGWGIGEDKPNPQHRALLDRKGVIAEFQPGGNSHGKILSRRVCRKKRS